MQTELTFYEFLNIFFQKRRLIAFFILLFVIPAAVYCVFAPQIYRAESLIMPASQKGNQTSAMLAQLGGLASFMGIGGGTTGELLMGVLRSKTIVDRVIDRFNLMESYEEDTRLKMREKVTDDILHANEDVKSGIVSVAVLDEDPQKAADMANFFVEELQKQMQTLVVGEAAQRRIFFESQVTQAFKALGDAEDEMARYQEQSGLVAVQPQLQVLLTSIAQLKAQIAAKEVEISGLRTYARQDNPRLRLAQSQLAAMRTELAKLEEQQKNQGQAELKGKDEAFSSMSQAPHLGLEYQRRLRDVKFAEAMYELMLKQFEAAKLDEANEAIVVQVLDPATPPDYKFKPKRAAIMVFSALAGLCLGMLWVMGDFYFRNAREALRMKQMMNTGEQP